MSDPVTDFETGLYNALNVSAVTSLATGGVWGQLAPQGTPLPYLIFQWQAGGDVNDNPQRERMPLYTVKGVAVDKSVAEAISGAADLLLHGQALTISGWVNYQARREGDVNYSEQPTGLTVYHVGGIYRFKIQKT